MVTITKNSQELQVTKGAYRQMYKPLGWSLVDKKDLESEEYKSIEKNLNTTEKIEISKSNEDDDKITETKKEDLNEEDQELLERPLSSLTISEIYRYANIIGLELEEGLSKAQAREALKKALN